MSYFINFIFIGTVNPIYNMNISIYQLNRPLNNSINLRYNNIVSSFSLSIIMSYSFMPSNLNNTSI